MTLRTRFADDLKHAMKARDECRTATLRLILATLKDRDIASRGEGRDDGLGEDEVLEMLAKMIRQRRESAKVYDDAGRKDLAEQERSEIAVIESYMPKPLDAAEAEAAVRVVLGEIGATSVKDIGRTMAALKERYAGRMDFAKASAQVRRILAGDG